MQYCSLTLQVLAFGFLVSCMAYFPIHRVMLSKRWTGLHLPNWRRMSVTQKASAIDEYGYFVAKRGIRPELNAQSEVYAPRLRLFNNVDHLWSSFDDQQVELGISSLRQNCTSARYEKLVQILGMRTDRIRMVFENPSNTNNLWAALRTFDSFGIQFVDVIVDENAKLVSGFNQDSMAQAMGTQKWLTLSQYSSTVDRIKQLKQEGYRVVVSDVHASSRRLQDIDWKGVGLTADKAAENEGKIAIVMGNEKHGISEEMRTLADELFYIPMKGFAESFNLSAASAVICAYLESQGALSTPLEESTMKRILLMWLTRSVHASIPILQKAGLPIEDNLRMYEEICGVSSQP